MERDTKRCRVMHALFFSLSSRSNMRGFSLQGNVFESVIFSSACQSRSYFNESFEIEQF